MKSYIAEHKTEAIAEKHIERIEKRGGVANLLYKSGKYIVNYAFPEVVLPNETLYKVVYFQDAELGNDVIDISIIEYSKSLFDNVAFAKNRFFVLVNGNYSDNAIFRMKHNLFLNKSEYRDAGTTLGEAKATVKELENATVEYKKNSKKIQESKKKGNNFYIRFEKKQNSIKGLFKKYKYSIK